jgi:hypothetical protein
VPLRLEAGHRRRHQAHREAVRRTEPHSVVASPAAGNGSGAFAFTPPTAPAHRESEQVRFIAGTFLAISLGGRGRFCPPDSSADITSINPLE